jgi:hypothetical protein
MHVATHDVPMSHPAGRNAPRSRQVQLEQQHSYNLREQRVCSPTSCGCFGCSWRAALLLSRVSIAQVKFHMRAVLLDSGSRRNKWFACQSGLLLKMTLQLNQVTYSCCTFKSTRFENNDGAQARLTATSGRLLHRLHHYVHRLSQGDVVQLETNSDRCICPCCPPFAPLPGLMPTRHPCAYARVSTHVHRAWQAPTTGTLSSRSCHTPF